MDSSGNRAIVFILAAALVLAALVAVFGYPVLITVAVIAAFAALASIVVLSAGDKTDKPARPAARVERRAASATS